MSECKGYRMMQNIWPFFSTSSIYLCPDYHVLPSFLLIYCLLEWDEGRERERVKVITERGERNINPLPHIPPNQGLTPQPEHVPQLGEEPATIQCTVWCSGQAAPARVKPCAPWWGHLTTWWEGKVSTNKWPSLAPFSIHGNQLLHANP